MKINFNFILIIFFLFSCSSTSKLTSDFDRQSKTITTKSTKKLDTVLFISKQKLFLNIPKSQLINSKRKFFYKKKDMLSMSVKIDSLGFYFLAECDSLKKRLFFYETVEKEIHLENLKQKTKIIKEKGYNLFEVIVYCLLTGLLVFAITYFLKTIKII